MRDGAEAFTSGSACPRLDAGRLRYQRKVGIGIERYRRTNSLNAVIVEIAAETSRATS